MGDVIAFERQSRFTVEDFDTIQASKMPWRVKGLWPSVGVCFVAGPSTSGKSFRVLNWIANVGRGLPVLGRRSLRAGVLYIASEGAEGVRNRIVGLRNEVGKLGSAFRFIGQAPNLTDPEDVADLRVTIGEVRQDMDARGGGLGVVVIDTLAASTPGADENSSKDMGPVLNALQTLAIDLGLLVVVIAHTGKDETRGMRGWSGLLGNADGLVMIDDPKGEGTRTGTVVKVKDGASGQRFAFTLRVVEIGTDSEGDAVTTCIAEDAELPEELSGGVRLSAQSLSVLQALGRLLDEGAGGIVPPVPGAKDGTRGVMIPALREQAYLMGLQKASEPSADAPDAERRKWVEARKKAFQRAVEKLQEARKVRQEGDWIWPL